MCVCVCVFSTVADWPALRPTTGRQLTSSLSASSADQQQQWQASASHLFECESPVHRGVRRTVRISRLNWLKLADQPLGAYINVGTFPTDTKSCVTCQGGAPASSYVFLCAWIALFSWRCLCREWLVSCHCLPTQCTTFRSLLRHMHTQTTTCCWRNIQSPWNILWNYCESLLWVAAGI